MLFRSLNAVNLRKCFTNLAPIRVTHWGNFTFIVLFNVKILAITIDHKYEVLELINCDSSL